MSDPSLVTTTLLLDRLHDSRDEEAWRTFDLRFRGVIVTTARRFGLPDPDAEDAAQETMLQAVREYRAGGYDRTKGRLSSWIVGIAHHRIIDALRRSRSRGARETAGEPSDMPVAPDTIARAFEDALERKIFTDAWEHVLSEQRLTPPTLRAFELTALRGVPAAEAAKACDMTTEQVYVARTRVARRLRDVVEGIDRAVRDGL